MASFRYNGFSSMPATFGFHLLAFCIAFGLIWFGAGMTVSSVTSLAHSWRLPRFIISFFLLGILTSLPELSIGTLATLEGTPEIFAGNLLGGVIIIFLGLIPLLGIIGNGVKLPTQLTPLQVSITLGVIVMPALLTLDRNIGKAEGLFLVILYLSLFFVFSFRQPFGERLRQNFKRKTYNLGYVIKVIVGAAIVMVASQQIISSTLFFAHIFNVSPFFISLVLVSFGTNLPELSIIVRAITHHKKDIALADYLGSASANTFLFGLFTLLSPETVTFPNHFLQRFSFIIVGLVLFWIFSRSKNIISRSESWVLLALYGAFLISEIRLIQ